MKLKPCPFCGEKEMISIKIKEYKAIEGSYMYDEINGYIYSYVECLPCGARTEECFESDIWIIGGLSAKHNAIDAWNRRS